MLTYIVAHLIALYYICTFRIDALTLYGTVLVSITL